VEPLPSAENDPLYMIAFVEVEVPQASDGDPASAPEIREATAGVADLERENRELRERVQSTAEEHAAAIEELRSSNEELQSVNEELQSTNEELETSREEIQSVNEELNTVNGQLSAKVEQLDRSNGDLKNLFDSTNLTASLILLDCGLTKGPAAGTAWQDENQSARETDTQGGDGIRHVAL
jgi:two-component system, chemotaxis family, CheB/CheR fusion protein